jgi:hypothetical protein
LKEAFTQPSTVEIHKVFLDSSRPDLEVEATRREWAGGVLASELVAGDRPLPG